MRLSDKVRAFCFASATAALAFPTPALAQKDEVKVDTRLLFASLPPGFQGPDGKRFDETFLWSGLEKFRDIEQNKRLTQECFGELKDQTFLPALLGFLVGPAISFVSGQIKESFDEELKKYSKDFRVSEQASFYAPGSKKDERRQAWQCVRVSQTSTTLSGTDGSVQRTLDFDLIMQVAVVGEKDSVVNVGPQFEQAYGIKIRPLRVYLGKPLAKGSRIGMAGSVTFDAVWREDGVGKKGTLFTAGLFERKFTRDKQRLWSREPFYFPSRGINGTEDPAQFPAWTSIPLQPLVPFSSAGIGGSNVTLTANFTQVGDGDGKGGLKFIAGLFDKTKGDLESIVAKAAKKLIEPEKPTPPAKPDLFCGTITPNSTGGQSIQWTKTDVAACPGN